MNNTPTDWVSSVAILAGGLILGLLFVYFFTRRKTAVIAGDLDRQDLEAKRDALVAQLRALDPGADDERRRLESETAAVLRELDRHGPATAAKPAAPVYNPKRSAMSPALQGVLWGAGSFCLLAVLAYFVTKQSTPRQEGMEATGGFPGQGQQTASAPPPQQQVSPVIAQLEAAVQREPNNLQIRDDLAQAYLETDNLMGVFEQTKFVLEKNPNDFRALTLQALVRMAMGEQEVALQMLEKSSTIEPKNLDTWVSLAWVHMQSGDPQKAEAAIARAAAVSPADKPRLEQVFTEMKAAAARTQQQQTQAAAGGLPEGHPPLDPTQQPGAAPAPAPAPAPASGPAIRITLDVDPSARARITRDGVLFVIARTAPGTPPVAVKRVVVTGFPMTVDLSSADSMMGQPLPGKVRVEARFDTDRDAATRPPTDPAAAQDGVAVGSAISLALK